MLLRVRHRLSALGRQAGSQGGRGFKSVPYGELSIGVPKETTALERRVAQTPESIKKLLKEGFGSVLVEKGAGAGADFSDAAYTAVGATIVDRDAAFGASLVTKVMPPTPDEAKVRGAACARPAPPPLGRASADLVTRVPRADS